MAKKQQINLADYSDEDLIATKNRLAIEYGRILDECSTEIAYLVNEKKVDPYSFFGERKINKVITRYADMSSDVQIAMEEIGIELEKRDNFKYEQSFIGGKKYFDDSISQEEFLRKEALKTLKHQSALKQDEEE
ncbi:MAG: hypothetical protein IKD36_03045 [Clostridia bacterium]|nr:hypothetical protein [Clostridia bacterium]